VSGAEAMGAFLHAILNPAEQDGPPWTHPLSEEEAGMDGFDGLDPLLDSDGPWQTAMYVGPGDRDDPANPLGLMDLVGRIPLRPHFTIGRRPVFTGCLAYLEDLQ
jgi:hypothetical protein